MFVRWISLSGVCRHHSWMCPFIWFRWSRHQLKAILNHHHSATQLIQIYTKFAEFCFNFFLQIGSLKNYYLFHHHHVAKRSLDHSEKYHSFLNTEPEVRFRYIDRYRVHTTASKQNTLICTIRSERCFIQYRWGAVNKISPRTHLQAAKWLSPIPPNYRRAHEQTKVIFTHSMPNDMLKCVPHKSSSLWILSIAPTTTEWKRSEPGAQMNRSALRFISRVNWDGESIGKSTELNWTSTAHGTNKCARIVLQPKNNIMSRCDYTSHIAHCIAAYQAHFHSSARAALVYTRKMNGAHSANTIPIECVFDEAFCWGVYFDGNFAPTNSQRVPMIYTADNYIEHFGP